MNSTPTTAAPYPTKSRSLELNDVLHVTVVSAQRHSGTASPRMFSRREGDLPSNSRSSPSMLMTSTSRPSSSASARRIRIRSKRLPSFSSVARKSISLSGPSSPRTTEPKTCTSFPRCDRTTPSISCRRSLRRRIEDLPDPSIAINPQTYAAIPCGRSSPTNPVIETPRIPHVRFYHQRPRAPRETDCSYFGYSKDVGELVRSATAVGLGCRFRHRQI